MHIPCLQGEVEAPSSIPMPLSMGEVIARICFLDILAVGVGFIPSDRRGSVSARFAERFEYESTNDDVEAAVRIQGEAVSLPSLHVDEIME